MASEQEERIKELFIMEAEEHLVTLENGLVDLKSTISDTETINDMFRAAHSVKGGAAMLGMHSVKK
ncbi:MAG: Hpt domain-containing protein, partial [Trichodesmium sp. St16_bin2-tuft]|nr:Hpt domain-containing protein [Trichodesmium sp. St16_bin2-tuft]